MNVILLASVGVIILLVGGGVGFWAGRSGVGGGKARLEKAEAELDEYKRSVTEHFGQTAEHFQAIGKQYRELYEHMASGAQALCEPDEAGKPLLFAPGAENASGSVENVPADSVAEEEIQPPVDYEEQPTVAEAADVLEAAEEPAVEQQVTEVDEESVSEAANDPQSETRADVSERTLH